MKRLKIAVVGLGKMGILHASILNTLPNVEVAALCDKSYFLRKFVSKLFKKARIVGDVTELADFNLDSIYITTPIPVHFPIIKRIYSDAIAKNIFVEKTLCASYEESKELCELVLGSGGIGMVGYMKRFAVSFQKAKEILNEGILGKITSFGAFAYSSDFSEVKKGSKATTARGGVLRDLGSHVIDLSLFYFDDFKVESAVLDSFTGENSEDSAQVKVKNATVNGQFNFSWCKENYRMPHFGIEIKGRKGVMRVTDETLELTHDGNARNWFKHDLNDHVKFLLGEPEYYREDAYFINALSVGNKVEPSFLTASKVDYVIDQIKKKATVNVSRR